MTARVLLLGFDGFSPDLASQWMDEGFLPTLKHLADHGSFAPLQSTFPPVTIPAWTSMMTGVNPGRHGMFDFTQFTPGTYHLEFVNSTYRQAETIWKRISEAGGRVASIGFPASFPPETLNGICISGFDSPVASTLDRSMIKPIELYEKIRNGPGLYHISVLDEVTIRPGWHSRALPLLLHNLKHKALCYQTLLQKEHWDCFAACFGESDTISHHYWMFQDTNASRYQPSYPDLKNAIRSVYIALDQIAASFMKMAGNDCIIIIVSDHGFGAASNKVLHLNNFLAQQGYLIKRPSVSWPRQLRDYGLRLLPRKLQKYAFRNQLRAVAESLESSVRFQNIDMEHTLAFSEELNYFPSIRFNVQGRYPLGPLPAQEMESFKPRLINDLLQWKDPDSQESIVRNVFTPDDIYHGPYLHGAPDLLLDLNLTHGESYTVLPSLNDNTSYRHLSPVEFFGGRNKGMNGTHRPLGVLFSNQIMSFTKQPQIIDITPTILSYLKIKYATLDGQALFQSAEQQVRQ